MTDLDLAGLAARLGRSYSWTQKHWRTHRHPATAAPIPLPYVGAGRGQHPLWLADPIDAWKAGQAPDTRGHPAQRDPLTAADNDAAPAPITDPVAALLAAAGG